MNISHFVMLLSAFFCNEVFAAKDKAEPTTGFNLVGYIQTFTIDDPADPLSKGSMTVNGTTVILPKNLKIVMPGTYLTANDIFRGKKGTATTPINKASCIALDDKKEPTCNGQPEFPYTVEIAGNIADIVDSNKKVIGQEYIAGLVNIGQIPLQTSGGFIQKICYTGKEPDCTMPGELLIGPKMIEDKPNSKFISARVRLNDPQGRFGTKSIPEQDDRFTVDDENPTVHAATGYPVCIPRNSGGDKECPLINRPKLNGKFLTRFTIGKEQAKNQRGIPAPGATACNGCNSHFMAPLVEGDYIIYSGTLQSDSKGTFISAYALEADLGIYTSPGVDPAYVFVEEALLGSGGTAFRGIDQETGPGKPPADRIIPGQTLVTRFKIVGFTTDPSRNVDVYAMDVINADSLEKSPRKIRSFQTEVTAPIGRFEMAIDSQVFMPPTREIRAQIAGIWDSKDPKKRISKEPELSANELTFGRYDAPVAEYLFPEGRVFGGKDPEPGLIPANFEDLCFLSIGYGPLDTLNHCTEVGTDCPKIHIVKPLEPWPASEREPRQTIFKKTTPSQTELTHQPPGIFCKSNP